MLELATMNEWWRLTARYPEFRQHSHAMLKDFGYMRLMDLLESRAPTRALEFGHGFNSTLLARYQDAFEMWGVDDHQGLPYFPEREQWDQWYREHIETPCPRAHLVRGLLAPGDGLDLPTARFDAIVSVSVVEEVPADTLNGIVVRSAELLAPGGVFAGTLDVQLTNPQRIEWLKDAIDAAGLRLVEDAPADLMEDFNSLLIESPSMVMLTYQLAEGEDRRFGGHWSSTWFVAEKPKAA